MSEVFPQRALCRDRLFPEIKDEPRVAAGAQTR